MASIPLKNMTTIYNRASQNAPDKVRMGNYSAKLDYPRFQLWHYGTLILTLDIERGRVYARRLNLFPKNYLYP